MDPLHGFGSQLTPGQPMDSKHVTKRLTFDGQHWTTAQTQGGGLCAGGRVVGGTGKFGTFIPGRYGLAPCEQKKFVSRSISHFLNVHTGTSL